VSQEAAGSVPGVMRLELTTPDRRAVELEVTEVIVPGSEGVFTVLYDHTPLLSILDVGVLYAGDVQGQGHFFAVHGGFAEISDNNILVMAQAAEESAEIELERAESARERAERRLNARGESEDIDLARAELALRRAVSRIQAHGHVVF